MTDRIRVAQVITRMDWGGSPDIVRMICEDLDKEKFSVKLVCGKTLNPSRSTESFFMKHSKNVFFTEHLKREISPLNDLRAFFELLSFFRKNRFDIVHTHTAKAGFLGRFAAKAAGVKLIFHTPHGHNLYGYFNAFFTRMVILLERMASLAADKTVVLTGIEKDDLLRYNIDAAEKVEVIKSGIDIGKLENIHIDHSAVIRKYGIEEGSRLVGVIARLEKVKGCRYFLSAARIVAGKIPEARFLVAGEGSLKSDLMKLAAKYGISGKVNFAGWSEYTPEIISLLDILAIPSLNEAVGRVILEAGALSKPVVATAVGGIPEIVEDGVTGILVPPKDAEKMASAIIELLRDEGKRIEMGRASRRRVRRHYSKDLMLSQLQNIYLSS